MTNPVMRVHAEESGAQMAAAQQMKSGANWFYWIAGLSVINSVIALAGGGWYFILGLGLTQIVDGIALSGFEDPSEVTFGVLFMAFIFDLIIAGIFVAFGYLANKEQKWAFITGMVVYALDGLIFIMVMDFLSIGFHVFALYAIYRGFAGLQQMERLRAEAMMAKTGMVKAIG